MHTIFVEHWPWWAGGLALSALTVAYWWLVGRPLGVSGAWARVVGWEGEREAERAEASMGEDEQALMAALDAATLEEFGGLDGTGDEDDCGDEEDDEAREAIRTLAMGRRVPVGGHAVFLVGLVLGGFLGAIGAGEVGWELTLGREYQSLFGGGIAAWTTLLVGGVLVGYGTRMAGGCTSGHGLSGCSLLRPASLLATAAFFGTAVAVSLLLEGVLS
ncbi:MAG: YeeE/YedE family protein [Myxococcota bacterium]